MRTVGCVLAWSWCVAAAFAAPEDENWRRALARFHALDAEAKPGEGLRLLTAAFSAAPDAEGRATLHYWIGVVHHDNGDHASAERAYRRSVAEASFAGAPATALRTTALTDLSVLYLDSARRELALRTVEEALSAGLPADDRLHRRAQRARSITLSALGRTAEAEGTLRALLEHTPDSDRVEKASLLNDLANTVTRQGRAGEAIPLLTHAIDLVRDDGPKTQLPRQLINLAEAELRAGAFEPASRHSTEGIALLTQLYGPEHPDLAVAWNVHARALKGLGRREEAKAAKSRGERLARGMRSATVDRYELGLR